MSWTEEKVAKLKELWGKGNTASQIAEIIGGISRNAVIGKAHRLNLSAKIKTRSATSTENFNNSIANKSNKFLNKGRRSKFKSLLTILRNASQFFEYIFDDILLLYSNHLIDLFLSQ